MVTNGAITNINGLELEGRNYELLPGGYTVGFRYILRGEEVHAVMRGYRQRDVRRCNIETELKPGHQYQITRKNPTAQLQVTGKRKVVNPSTVKGDLVKRILLVELDAEQRLLDEHSPTCD
ncbi:MAG: hypothetical protein GY944_28225 [bacterium]|nr:hypothetical protein [bacterium]